MSDSTAKPSVMVDRWVLTRFDDSDLDDDFSRFPCFSDAEMVVMKLILGQSLRFYEDDDAMTREDRAIRTSLMSAMAKVSELLKLQLPGRTEIAPGTEEERGSAS